MLPGLSWKVALAKGEAYSRARNGRLSLNKQKMVIGMNKKEAILVLLQDSELTVPQIAGKMEIDENNARVYVNRLNEEGKIREISKEGKAKVWTVASELAETTTLTLPIDYKILRNLAKRLILLMIKAGVNSDAHGIVITEEEIRPYILELQDEGTLTIPEEN